MKNIFIYSYVSYVQAICLFRYSKVFSSKKILNKIKYKNKIEISEDLLDARDYRLAEYFTSYFLKKKNNKFLKKNYLNFFELFGYNNEYGKKIEEKELFLRFSRILRLELINRKLKKRYPSDNFFFFINNIDYLIYKKIKKNFIFKNFFKIDFFCIVYLIITNFSKNLYFYLKLLFFPEFFVFKTCFKKNIVEKKLIISKISNGCPLEKKNYPYTPDFFLDEKNIKKDDVLFYFDDLCDLKINDSAYHNKFKIFNFNKDLIGKYNIFSYLYNHYKFIFYLRIKFLISCFLNFSFTNIYFKSFYPLVLWRLFYSIFDVKINILLNADVCLSSAISHKKNKTKTIYFYPNTTHDLFKNKNLVSNYEYSYLFADIFVSDLHSIKWIKCQKPTIQKFEVLPSIFSEYIKYRKKYKSAFKSQLCISSSKSIITFFDQGTGNFRGVMNYQSLFNFLKAAEFVNESNKYLVLYMPKKNFNYKYLPNSLYKLLIKLKNKITFIDRDLNQLNSYDIIAASDLIVSPPVSSIVFESAYSSTKTIIFDSNNQFFKHKEIYSIYKKNILAFNQYELLKKIDLYLQESDKDEFISFENSKWNKKLINIIK